jgi:uncharacterized membrane protein
MSEREDKRELFSEQEKSGSKKFIPVIVVLVAVLAIGGWFLFGAQSVGGPEVVSAGQDGRIYFTATDYDDGAARYYRYKGAAGPINFFLVKSNDGVIRSAFDTCDVCYKALKGYRQEGNEMVCNNCDMRFSTDKINVVKGGCNPAPLRRQQVGDSIAIAAADIERGAWYFKGLK